MKTNTLLLGLLLAVIVIFSGCADSPNSESTDNVSTPATSNASVPATSKDIGTNAEKPVETTSTRNIESIKSSALDVPYKDLYRYNEDYEGQIVYYHGEVLQTITEDGYTYWRIATKPSEYGGYIDDVIMVEAEDYSGIRLLEGDIVDVWGESYGLYTYTAVMGNEITIPILSYLDIELVEEDIQEPASFIVSEKGTLDNPAGIQEPVICSCSDKKYEVSVLDVKRGNEANNIIAEANMYNEKPPNGYEYALVKAGLNYLEGAESLDAGSYDFKAFCEGVECETSYVVLPENYKEFSSGILMPGGAKEGWLVFTVPTDKEALVSYQENMYMEGTACYINIGIEN